MRKLLFLGIYGAVLIVLIFIIILLIKRNRLKKYRIELEKLDKEKNEIESAPVISELAKLETIVKNAGCEVNSIKDKIYEDGSDTFGYDVLTGEYGDMFKMGVIDPTKVVRIALQNAASVAGQLLTSEGLLLDDVDEIMKMNALAKSFQAQ